MPSPRKIVAQVLESAGAVVGVRWGTEEPHYVTDDRFDGVEIRRYGPRIAAETTVQADAEDARNVGFRRLARYIFGGNHRDTQIAMTAPVAQRSGETIAMTAPVAQSSGRAESVIRFFMPAKWSLETLPTPDDDAVKLVEVPAEIVAVLRFTGDRSAATVERRTEELQRTLSRNGYRPAGASVAWFYDPPFTLPFRRRNEVVVPVEKT